MSAIVYQLQGVTKEYNVRPVVAVDNLTILPGEILALAGPSGAGKSTLLRLLNFLEVPTQGKIHFSGFDFGPGSEMPLSIRRKVTTVFQNPLLLNRSVLDNAAYGLTLQHCPDARPRALAALQRVGMEGQVRNRARSLSGGEAQRVALARAIVIEPEVLLLDEPTANLDPYNVGMIERIIQSINEERKTTIVLVTHNVFQARRLCHRAALMLEGKIIEVSDNETFFTHPQDHRTAAFTNGEMVY